MGSTEADGDRRKTRRDDDTVYAAFCVHKIGGIVLSTCASAWVSDGTDINYVHKAGAGGAIDVI